MHFPKFNVRSTPKEDTIRKWIRMFENTNSIVQIYNPGCPLSVQTQQSIEKIRISVRKNPSQSICKRSQELNIKKVSLHKIQKQDYIL